jgi:prepilin-type N-terminal cleavage/methylation domain-containing protein
LERGFTLIELIVVFAVLSTVAAVGVPPLLDASGDLRVRMAAEELVVALRSARWYAIRHSANVGVKFRQSGGFLTYSLYRDGDGDGVLTRDITSGVDPEVQAPRRLSSLGAGVGLGFPPGPPARDPGDPGRFLKPGDPVRFNQSDLASYSSLGGATPGSLYLTDGRKRLTVVRVLGRTGRVRVLTYNFAEQTWR